MSEVKEIGEKEKKTRVVAASTTIKDPVLGTYVIEIDGDNYSVVKDGGKFYRPVEGHFRSLGGALKRISALLTIQSFDRQVVELQTYLKEYERISTLIQAKIGDPE